MSYRYTLTNQVVHVPDKPTPSVPSQNEKEASLGGEKMMLFGWLMQTKCAIKAPPDRPFRAPPSLLMMVKEQRHITTSLTTACLPSDARTTSLAAQSKAVTRGEGRGVL